MRLLILTSNLRRGGVERRAILLAAAAVEAGHEVKLISLSGPNEYAELTEQLGPRWSQMRGGDSFSLRRELPGLVGRLRRVVREFPPDVCQVFTASALVVGTLALPRPVVYAVANTLPPPSGGEPLRRRLRWWTQKYALRLPGMYAVAASHDALEYAVTSLGVRRERARVIVNGIDVERFQPTKAKREPEMASASILCIGALSVVKNHAYAIEALRIAIDRGCSWRLTIAGNGPLREDLSRMIRRLGLEQHAVLVGTIDRPERLLEDSDVLWHTSHAEGFGQVVAEAMAVGTPVVATAVPGVREIIDNGRTGFLVDPGRPGDCVRVTTDLLSDRDLYRRIRSAGVVEVRRRFDARRMLGEFLALYLELTTGRKQNACNRA